MVDFSPFAPLALSSGILASLAAHVLRSQARSLERTFVGKSLKAVGLKERDFYDRLHATVQESFSLYFEEFPDYQLTGIQRFFLDPETADQISEHILNGKPIDIDKAIPTLEKTMGVTLPIFQRRGLTAETIIPNFVVCFRRVLARYSDERQMYLLLRLMDVSEDIQNAVAESEVRLKSFMRELMDDSPAPSYRPLIQFESLYAVTKLSIGEQVKSVGQGKFLPQLYVGRAAEQDISTFVRFEDVFLSESSRILDDLGEIAREYYLDSAVISVANSREMIEGFRSLEQNLTLISRLKHDFHFEEVEADVSLIRSSIRDSGAFDFDTLVSNIRAQLIEREYIDSDQIARLPDLMFDLARRSSVGVQLDEVEFNPVWKLFPSKTSNFHESSESVTLIIEILNALDTLVRLHAKRCAVIVGKAGTGKTNVLCHIAEEIIRDQPVILLDGSIELSAEYTIESHVQQRLEEGLGGVHSDWLTTANRGLEEARKWLFIVIDGINENNDLRLMINAFKRFLPKIEDKRIKLILSCRDLFWERFLPTLDPFLFEFDPGGRNEISLNEFTDAEWTAALASYFENFHIKGRLNQDLTDPLRNPLLLRFFCEAYLDQEIDDVRDIRLIALFDTYLDRIRTNISDRLGLLRPYLVDDFLIKLAKAMWDKRLIGVAPSSIGVTSQELSESHSIYNSVLSENIVHDKRSIDGSVIEWVRFTYDEFNEYVLARNWLHIIREAESKDETIERILHTAVDAIPSYSPSLGALLFLDQMLEQDGALVNKTAIRLASSGDTVMGTLQVALSDAFQNISLEHINDELIDALVMFERIAADDIKSGLGNVILRVFEKLPDHPELLKLIDRVLEITERERDGGLQIQETHDILSVQPSPDISEHDREASEKESKIGLLPPARFHYTEATKLAALSILVGVQTGDDYDRVERGMTQLGRMDLHSALQAVAMLDTAPDEFVYKSIHGYLKQYSAEYRIYGAWLLRNRFGETAATLLVLLLTDRDTRVHRFTFRMFDNRAIDAPLIDAIMTKLQEGDTLKPWHLVHFIRILRTRSNFVPDGLSEAYGPRIVEVLTRILGDCRGSLQLEVYRSLLEYSEHVDRLTLLEQMRTEGDKYVKALADRYSG